MQPTDTPYDLLDQSYDLPDGSPARLELLEQAVRLADSLGDIEAGWDARDALIDAATMGGYPEKTLVAFSWNLAQFDRVGDQYGWDEHDLLWKYKWVINSLWNFPSITRPQIEAAFSDFAARLERGGYSPRTLHYFRWKYEFERGDSVASEHCREQWSRAKRDDMSDCSACEASFMVDYQRDQPAAALEVAKPILSGRLRCAEVPHVTLAAVLEPMLKVGQFEEAVRTHLRGYKMIRDNQEFLISTGEHLAFLAYTHNLPKALELLERHLPWALATADMDRRYSFYRDSLVLMRRLRDASQQFAALKVPKDFAVQPSLNGLEVAALEMHLRSEATTIAAAFDARNGTDKFIRGLSMDEALLEIPFVSLELPETESATKNKPKRKS